MWRALVQYLAVKNISSLSVLFIACRVVVDVSRLPCRAAGDELVVAFVLDFRFPALDALNVWQ